MNKKIPFLIAIVIIIVCAVLVGGFVVWQYLKMPTEIKVVETKLPEKKTFDDKDCDELEEEIKNLLEEVNYCEDDSDCAFEWGYYCPFGCYKFFNKNSDLDTIDKKVKMYNENCISCEYICPQPPKLEDVKCLDGKCVDVRFK